MHCILPLAVVPRQYCCLQAAVVPLVVPPEVPLGPSPLSVPSLVPPGSSPVVPLGLFDANSKGPAVLPLEVPVVPLFGRYGTPSGNTAVADSGTTRWCRGSTGSGSTADPSGSTAEGFSAAQRLVFQDPLFKGSFFSKEASSSILSLPPLLTSSKLQDLPIPPPKLAQTLRIEGEGQDLQVYQGDLIFPLIYLRDLCLGFPLENLGPLLYLLVVCVTDSLLGSPQFGCGCVPHAVVKVRCPPR